MRSTWPGFNEAERRPLVALMRFKIQAICAFCFLSAGLSLALWMLYLLGREWDDSGQLLFRSVILVVVVGLLSLAWVFHGKTNLGVQGRLLALCWMA